MYGLFESTNMKKKLILVFCLSLIFCPFAVAAKNNPCDIKSDSNSIVPIPKLDKESWISRHNDILKRIKQGKVDIIMVGDSITHFWETAGKGVWDKYYANRNVVNMGISGDKTQNVIWRLEHGEVNNINPKLAVLMIGTNNSKNNDYTSQQIADGVKAIVCQLRTRLPQTKILILAIPPRGSDQQRKDKTLEGTFNPQWEKNEKANKIISKLADDKMIYYLDINKKFLNKKGVLTRDIMPDLLHPGEKGYQILAEAMEPMIVKLTGEKK
jgi:beta-glucosidase